MRDEEDEMKEEREGKKKTDWDRSECQSVAEWTRRRPTWRV